MGPQTAAWLSLADELFYGGAVGGGKSSLLCGLAVAEHRRSILFRREFPQIKGLVDEVARIRGGSRDGYNSQDKLWRLGDGRELEFGSVPHEDDKDKYQGRPHDLIGFDEITHFTESQYRFLIGWNRTTIEGQRCRIVCAGNPPLTAEGAWVIKRWAPWLDPNHPNPAKPGELRWFIVVGGIDIEVDGCGPHAVTEEMLAQVTRINGQAPETKLGTPLAGRSRTFIKAVLEDNPFLMRTNYAATVESMREPMRTMLREGRFDLAVKDDDKQVIPTAWIMEAQSRWTARPPTGAAMTAVGLDPAGGGRDDEAMVCRYGGWFSEVFIANGPETADGGATAANVIRRRRDNCPVAIDVGGGYGGGVIAHLKDNGIPIAKFNGVEPSTRRTKDGALQFANKRAEAWWTMREELDPNQEGGSVIALPPDADLRADLAAPHWELTTRGIKLESKDDIRKRLGRSPGKGDACCIALAEGERAAAREAKRRSGRLPEVNIGHSAAKALYRR